MLAQTEESKKEKQQVAYWNRYTREREGIIFKFYSSDMIEEEKLSIVMDIIQNNELSDVSEKTIANAIIQQCFNEEEVNVVVRRMNQGKNWIVKIQ